MAEQYIGEWNATTNVPDISATTPTVGDFYMVAVAGSTDLNGITTWEVGDKVLYQTTGWRRLRVGIDYSEGSYLSEFQTAYELMLSLSSAADTPHQKVIDFLEQAYTDGVINDKQKVESSAMIMASLQNSITVSSQKTALALVEKKFRFAKELELLDIQIEKVRSEKDVVIGSQADKILMSEAQKDKAVADARLTEEQKIQLIAGVDFNNKIKAADSMADMFGTFGAGGITMSSDMWAMYFTIINGLASVPVPGSTTVSKVT